jgi:NAD(P)H-dependent flavin oxidoreductase YrpB (nitropropane dioxygenase family)
VAGQGRKRDKKSAGTGLAEVAAAMNPRRLSQAIAEGDGISVIVVVDGPEAARDAEDAGAEGLVIPEAARAELASIRGATDLPIAALAGTGGNGLDGADACIVEVRDDAREPLERAQRELGESFELAFRIENEDHLAFVLEEFDPEILVLAAPSDDRAPLERVLALLPDIPAGKLAIADIQTRSRLEVEELERAGIDGVIVAGDAAGLVGASPPEV